MSRATEAEDMNSMSMEQISSLLRWQMGDDTCYPDCALFLNLVALGLSVDQAHEFIDATEK
jgi:hypothetical protein